MVQSFSDFRDACTQIAQQNITNENSSVLAQIDIIYLQEIFKNVAQIPDENILADLVLRIIEIDSLKKDFASSLVYLLFLPL
jgi:hypothetical protein